MDALNSPNDPRYPRSTSELEVDERDSKGGRIDREIELGMSLRKGEWNTTNTMNTVTFSTKEKNSYIKNNIGYSLTFVHFKG